jgi:hypothetical protein
MNYCKQFVPSFGDKYRDNQHIFDDFPDERKYAKPWGWLRCFSDPLFVG